MRTRRRMRLAGAAGVLGWAIVLSGCNRSPATPATVVEVQAAPAKMSAITRHTDAEAILSPMDQAAISAKVSAPIRKFYVQRGSRVHAGELLATLENRDLSAAMEDNRGALQSAQAAYTTAVHAQVPQDYQRAQLDLQQAEANLKLNREIVKDRQQLFSQGAIPGRDLDTAKAALVEAETTYAAAEKRLQSMEAVGRAAELENANGQLASAKGKYQAAEAELSYTEIRSPIAGIVTDRPLFAGETAVAGTPLITVMSTSSLLAKLHLPNQIAESLKVGDDASVEVPGLDQSVAGKISLISPALDPGSTTVEVWVLLKNPQGQLRPGTAVHVMLAGKSFERALVVPSTAIVTADDGKKTVMVVTPSGTARRTEVKTGIDDNGMTQILSGISAGQEIVTQGAYALDDGTHVKVTAADDTDSDDGAGK
jgi:HlyD family secretion protein